MHTLDVPEENTSVWNLDQKTSHKIAYLASLESLLLSGREPERKRRSAFNPIYPTPSLALLHKVDKKVGLPPFPPPLWLLGF